METMMSVLVGVLFTVGIYLLLEKTLIRVILGSAVISHAANLLIITMGGLKKGGVPLLSVGGPPYSDPIPQALILTAIVINFAVTAFLLVLAYRSYAELGTDDLERLKDSSHD